MNTSSKTPGLFRRLTYKIPIFRSLKAYIFLLMLIIGIVPSDIMRLGILNNYEERAVNLRGSDVASQYRIIANHLVNYNYLQNPTSDVVNAELEQMSNLYDGRVLIINSNFRIVKDTYAMSEGKTMISEEVIKCFRGESTTRYDKTNGYIEMTVPITETVDGEKGQTSIVRGVILASASTDSIATTLDILSRKALILEIVMGIIIIGIVFFFSHILIMPFKRVTQAISEVKDGFTDEPISVPDYLETEHIVDAFNQLLGRMKVINDSRQEFVSNVSHELKTPLQGILGSAELIEKGMVQPEDVPHFIGQIRMEATRMVTLIGDIIRLSQLDEGDEMPREKVELLSLAEEVTDSLKDEAAKKKVTLVVEGQAASIEGVRRLLYEIFYNLCDNAIKYNVPGGSVHFFVDSNEKSAVVKVADTGIGIPAEDQSRVFERFYRVDKSHSKASGGTGLGLSIVKHAVQYHHGSIELKSEPGKGTEITCIFPK